MKGIYKFYAAVGVILLLGSSLIAGDNAEISAGKFLKNLRASHPVNTWADMQGDIIQKKRLKSGSYETNRAKIKVGILFTKGQAVAMIKLSETDLNDVNSEVYKVGQPYTGGVTTVISSNLEDESLIGNYGVNPGDFTMSFLWWELNKENSNQTDTVKGLNCRILQLENPKTEEFVRVFASIDYYYPLKVQWFKKGTDKPYRSMLIESFRRDGDLGAPNNIILSGPGWKTKVDFEQVKLGFSKDGISKGLFQ